jgi:S-DNA-T family DNA segregation ATPase FtsK/SpoIIIE
MAKRKKRSSSDSSKALGGSAAQPVKVLLFFGIFIFFFAAVFSDNGSAIAAVHKFYRLLLGGATPFIGFFMLWYAAKRLFPQVVSPRSTTILGAALFTLCMAGFLHSFAVGDKAVAAAAGMGGGWIGQLVFSGLNSAFGDIISRLFLTVFALISLILILDKVILQFLHVHNNPDTEEEEDEPVQEEAKVKVMGELRPGPLQRLSQRLNKPGAPSEAVPVKTMPVLKRSTNWNYPSIELLKNIDEKPQAGNLHKKMELIQKTLRDFGIDVTMTDVRIGPTVSQYTLKPADGVKLTQITARQDDLALALAAESLRVEAPIPGKSLVGVEIPNDKKAMVGLKDLLKSKVFASSGSKLTIALGRDSAGEPSIADLTRMPHVLIAGATGSGKSVCINTLILSLLMNNSPEELRMILVDPKRVELTLYNNIPHLLCPVINEPKDTVKALNWCVREMERRYKVLASTGKRNIEQYNQNPDLGEGPMPFIVVVIDELADLMMASAREVESKIVRLAQMARAVGIHLVVATQRPSVDVITGLIKANIPTRIAFAVTSQIDSRTIIDTTGAEKLLGLGDMLYMSTDLGKPRRVQGVYCSEEEITSVIAHIRQQETGNRYDPTILEEVVESRFIQAGGLDDEEEALLREAYELVKKHRRASTSMLQTYMKLGYNKAKRIVTAMEERGMIGPERGGKQREVFNIAMDGESPLPEDSDTGIVAYPENE